MATFYNQATLNFGGTATSSNVTEGELLGSSSIGKLSASADYTRGDGITYVVSLSNTSSAAQNDLTLDDNLGLFTPVGGTTPVVPLDYVEGSVLFYINGILQPEPTVNSGTSLVISGLDIPAGANALIIYEARANIFAPLAEGSSITNTVTLSGAACPESAEASTTVPVRDTVALTVAKALCPLAISECGAPITYTFVIQNTGNTAATEGITLNDTFTPILGNLTVTLDGEELEAGTGYTYDETTGEFATVDGAITVPPATFTTDPVTGIVSSAPGVAVLTVSGTV